MAHGTNNPSPSADELILSEIKYTTMVKHIIDIPLPEELKLSERSIYKVPYNLLKVNDKAYTPQCISIGPIHFDNKELKPMQEHKLRYFHFFGRDRVLNEQSLQNYKHYLENNEEEIRICYAEKFNMPKEKFVDMMLLDAVFIMELLLRNCELTSHQQDHKERLDDDLIMRQSWLIRIITRDLILLENQIPFFELQKLYDDVVPCHNKQKEHASFADLASEYFAFYDIQMSSSDENETRKHCGASKSKNMFGEGGPKHFTDLIRYFYLRPTECKRAHARHIPRTATKLQDSGVSFKKDVKKRLLDINFEKTPILSSFLCFGCLPCSNYFKARLRIPQLKVDLTTECIFRNLIAFEQCHYPDKPYICNYVSLLDSLIHTQLDVELLVEKEVIVHELGSDKEVATLVNGLSKHVVTNSTCYYVTINELNEHYLSKWNHTVAALRFVYFRDLWRVSSTVVGIAVLVFTAFQFVRAVRVLF